MPSRTGYCYDDLFLEHEIAPGHAESPLRLAALHAIVNETGLLAKLVRIKPLTDESYIAKQITLVHTQSHYDSVRSLGTTGTVALGAVGAALAAVDTVVNGEVNNAFCAIRPPGHHVHNSAHHDGRGQGEGFCFFNNAAIAARYAQRNYGLARVLIIDWDFHHGNGTEDAFYTDPSVFYFSTHRLHAYPGTGYPLRTGEGPGKGYTLNVPLPSPDDPYGPVEDDHLLRAFDDFLLPALDKVHFTPNMIIISAGFDSRENDFLGNFSITDDGFSRITRRVTALAQKTCGGRVVSVLEGGYNPEGLAKAACAHLNALIDS